MQKITNNLDPTKKIRDLICGAISIILLIISLIVHDFNIFFYGSLINFIVFLFINAGFKNYYKAKFLEQIGSEDYNTTDSGDIK